MVISVSFAHCANPVTTPDMYIHADPKKDTDPQFVGIQ